MKTLVEILLPKSCIVFAVLRRFFVLMWILLMDLGILIIIVTILKLNPDLGITELPKIHQETEGSTFTSCHTM